MKVTFPAVSRLKPDSQRNKRHRNALVTQFKQKDDLAEGRVTPTLRPQPKHENQTEMTGVAALKLHDKLRSGCGVVQWLQKHNGEGFDSSSSETSASSPQFEDVSVRGEFMSEIK